MTENKHNPENKPIRFIDGGYKELFAIPDGGRIVVTRPMGETYPGVQEQWVGTCKFLDECHTEINGECFHICKFAETQERIGAKYEPETASETMDGYRVVRRTVVGEKVFKFGVNPDAARPYATWMSRADNPETADFPHCWPNKTSMRCFFGLRAKRRSVTAQSDTCGPTSGERGKNFGRRGLTT
jgi:hypothetical protein